MGLKKTILATILATVMSALVVSIGGVGFNVFLKQYDLEFRIVTLEKYQSEQAEASIKRLELETELLRKQAIMNHKLCLLLNDNSLAQCAFIQSMD